MKSTLIQWCDGTINPVMGCDGCELWPTVARIIKRLVFVLLAKVELSRRRIVEEVEEALQGCATASSVWHARDRISRDLAAKFPRLSIDETRCVIEDLFRCYAGHLHLNRGENPERPDKKVNSGHAPLFERPTLFAGRMKKASGWSDLHGHDREGSPWLDGLPRTIFVSDMGDALSENVPFSFLKDEIIDNVTSEAGSRHLWLWLTKRPARMAEIGAWLQTEHELAWPRNLVAMTSVTNRATRSRIAELRSVPVAIRGLSVEPLVEEVTLDLEAVDWVIVGGESGTHARSFDLSWARQLREQCEEAGVAFFVKQLGSNPVEDGFPVLLRDGHGGLWSEWPEDLRIRKFPKAFFEYRAEPVAA